MIHGYRHLQYNSPHHIYSYLSPKGSETCTPEMYVLHRLILFCINWHW